MAFEGKDQFDNQIDMSTIDTVIFVDCDGVLNIGLSEKKGSVAFDKGNLKRSMQMLAGQKLQDMLNMNTERKIAEAIFSIAERQIGHGENASYRKMAAEPTTCLSELFVGRLAKLIEMAGKQCLVVLSSTWRRPKYVKRLAMLEEKIAQYLRRPFVFQAQTPLVLGGEAPAVRLQLIGRFVADLCYLRGRSAAPLKVLVLEDFDCSPLGTWSLGGLPMDSEEAVEQYLENVGGSQVQAKLVHTYDGWETPSGQKVKIGCGLTMKHFCAGASFLGYGCDRCMAGAQLVLNAE